MSKLSSAELSQYVFSRTGASNDDVLVGPHEAEDAAALQTTGGTLVVSTDPVSLAAERIGHIGTAVASNDVAASGGIPEYIVSTILLPKLSDELLNTVTGQLNETCEQLGLTIVGGHTESVPSLERPLLSLTCMGYTDQFVSTATAAPGDRVLLTKGAGIEATAVLASDFRTSIHADEAVFERALSFFDELSVMPEAAVCTPVASAMHDPTEGGVLGGLVEIARASEVDIILDGESIPIHPATHELCTAMDLDPLRVLGSGALLATVPTSDAEDILDTLKGEGITTSDIGHIQAASDDVPAVIRDGQRRSDVVRDEMYSLWE